MTNRAFDVRPGGLGRLSKYHALIILSIIYLTLGYLYGGAQYALYWGSHILLYGIAVGYFSDLPDKIYEEYDSIAGYFIAARMRHICKWCLYMVYILSVVGAVYFMMLVWSIPDPIRPS